MSVRVLVADDQQLVRAGFRIILELHPEIEVVGEAADGAEAVAQVRQHTPDVVLMDIRMPGLDGIEATRRILAAGDDAAPRVLILTTFDLDEYIYDALKAGASGFLLKDVPPHQLAQAVLTVANGDALLSPAITRRLIQEFAASRSPRPTMPEIEQLSSRELEVFRLMARGMSNREIAAQLVVAETTVKTHVARILGKLAIRDRVQAVVLAYEYGIVSPGETPSDRG